MTPGWLRRRRSSRRSVTAETSLVGYALLLRRSDTDQEGAEILSTLEKRYELSPADEDGLQYRVVIDDAYDPDEAVVRLASVLDGIDGGWENRFGWPEAISPATSHPDNESEEPDTT
jgi:hypothetical protein